MASSSRSILSEQCKAEFEVLDAIYGQELVKVSENQLKVCNGLSRMILLLTC
jgi:hypothetical protein